MRQFCKVLTSRNTFSTLDASKKKIKYSWEIVTNHISHPLRNLSPFDILSVTPQLIFLTDSGDGKNQQSLRQENSFYLSTKLHKLVKYFYSQQPQKYFKNPSLLITESLSFIDEMGRCTATIAIMDPNTGAISLYMIGDSLYGIFKKQKIEMLEPQYEKFNKAIGVGRFSGYFPQMGYSQIIQRSEYNPDDIVLIASNGLWNNVNLNQIHYEVRGPNSYIKSSSKQNQKDTITDSKPISEICNNLFKLAKFYSLKGDYESPIYLNAKAQGINRPKEGFLDDITIVLAKVKKQIAIQ